MNTHKKFKIYRIKESRKRKPCIPAVYVKDIVGVRDVCCAYFLITKGILKNCADYFLENIKYTYEMHSL